MRTRLVAALSALLLVALLLISAGSYWLLTRVETAQLAEHRQRSAALLQEEMAAELDRLQAEVAALAGEVVSRLGEARQREPRVLAALADFQVSHAEVEQAMWVAGDGQRWLHFPVSQIPDRHALAQTLLARSKLQAPAVAPLLAAGASPKLRFIVPLPHSPLPGSDGHVVVDADFSRLQSLLRRYDVPALQLFVAAAGEVLTASSDLFFNPLPDAVRHTGASAGAFRLAVDGRDYELRLQPLWDDMQLGSLSDQALLARQVDAAVRPLTLMIAAILLLLGVLLYVVGAWRLLSPLRRLLGYAEAVLQGDRKVQPPQGATGGLAAMTSAVGEMGQRLQGANQSVMRLAYYDQLTNLPNRAALKESLTGLLETVARSHQQLAVLFIDLDDFKKVNDRLGHDAGDELLVKVSARLKQALRKGDLLGGALPEGLEEQLLSRRGGDEFNAVLPGIRDARDAAMVAERLITDISVPLSIAGSQVSVGASVGIALFPADGRDAETLLRHADMAMYQAKAQGKNKYYLFTESINVQVRRRLEMEQAVAIGLQRNEFELYYQPKLNLRSMEVVGFEALVRWVTRERGVVSPAEFVPLTEASQLIHDLGNWVIAEAMHQLSQWDEVLPRHMRVAINVSPRQIVEENFAGQFLSLAEQFGVPPSRLEVELTETSVLTDEVLVSEHLQVLRAAGVKVSLDDFGTGYSSLTFLRHLPIDAVKIDRSFVSHLNEAGGDQEIVVSVLELCRKLQLETIAEGVENADQMVILLNNGCGEAQGYLFAPAMPADEVLGFLSARALPEA